MTTQPNEEIVSYRADIDGLRALAILSVVLFHSGIIRLSGGFTGVDIFFVISGYLIGGHIWKELREGAFSYQHFYQRRARRILPALYAVTVFAMIAGLLLLSPRDLLQLGRSAFAATLSVSNILFCKSANYFAGSSDRNPLLMTWSLGVEEQFYFVIPWLMAIIARIRSRWILPAIAASSLCSFVFACLVSVHHPMAAFYLLPARAWELGVGVALAVYETKREQKTVARWLDIGGLSALGLMMGAMVVHRAGFATSPWTVLPAVAGTALAIAVPGSWVNRRLLSALPLRFIGRISYSWYLWHWPLLSLLHILYGGAIPAARQAEAVAVSFLLAVFSYFVIEQPFRRSAASANRTLLRYATASGVVLAACAAIWLSRGIPQRLPALAQMENPGEALRSDPCLAGLQRDQPNLSAVCYDTAGQMPVVALWGDSHSAAIAPGLRVLARTQGYAFAQLGKASCPPLTGVTHFIPRIPELAEGCARFNDAVLARLRADARIRIVILSAVWAAPFYRDWENGWLAADLSHAQQAPTAQAASTLFVTSLEATIDRLQQWGKQVIVLEDLPSFAVDPVWRVESARIPARRQLLQWFEVAHADDVGFDIPDSDPNFALSESLIEQAVAHAQGAMALDLKPALCNNSGQCAYRKDDTLLYVDGGHLSRDGALYAVRNTRLPASVRAD